MKKYKTIILIYLFFMLTLLCSCEKETAIDPADRDVPDELHKVLSEQVQIDAAITYKPDKNSYSSYELKSKSTYDENILCNLFFHNESPAITKNDYGELSIKTDLKTLHIGGYFRYFTDYYMRYLSIIEYLPFDDIQKFRVNFNGYPIENELQHFSKESALAQAEDIMNTLEIDYTASPLICAGITAETLEAFAREDTIQDYYKQYSLGTPTYTYRDEFYYMVYQLSIDNSVLFECNYRSDLSNIPSAKECGSYIVICIGRDEILQVQTGINWQVITDSQKEAHEWVAVSVVVDKISEYFDHYILKGTTVVKKIDFQYISIHDTNGIRCAVPAWIIYAENSADPSRGTLIFIDALTGEFIYL